MIYTRYKIVCFELVYNISITYRQNTDVKSYNMTVLYCAVSSRVLLLIGRSNLVMIDLFSL